MTSIRVLTAALSYAIALCGIVPLFPWLTTAPRLALAAGMAAGIWQDRHGPWPLKNWMLNTSIVPVFLFYALQFSRANAIQPVVSVLSIMLAVRLLGEKSARHYLQIHALSLFCLASSSLFDLSPVFLVYLGLMLLLVAVALVLLTFYALDSRMTLDRPDLRKVLAAGLLMPLASLPLMVFFFPILPRTQLPLWNLLPSPVAGVSGFSDKIEPGRSESITNSRVTAFRAEMQRQPQAQIYWRGTVFNRITGRRWIRDNATPAERITYSGPRVTQTIYPEQGPSRVLVALDAPAVVAIPQGKRTPDGTYELQKVSAKRLNYRAESVTSGILPIDGKPDHPFYLNLPDGIPARIRNLADMVRRSGDTDGSRVEFLEQIFRKGGYLYSMRDLPVGDQALEQFLFERKQGNCEFFASSFALLLRGAGVPARLVGGYLGGEYNDLGGYYLVSEEMAHVWVEAFIEGRGWVRIDPSSYAQNSGAVWGGSRTPDMLNRFRLALDSFNHSWNRSVISYDFERQMESARSAGKRLQGFEARKALRSSMPALMLLSGVIGAVFLFLRRKWLFPSPEERLLRSFYRRIERDCGIKPIRGRQGLYELASASGNKNVLAFVDIYAGAIYRDRRLTTEEYGQLKRILQEGF